MGSDPGRPSSVQVSADQRVIAGRRRFHYWRRRYWWWFIVSAPLWLPQALQLRRRALRFPAAPGPSRSQVDGAAVWCEQAATTTAALQVYGLGDSIIAGVGVAHSYASLSAALAQALAERMKCRVAWSAWGQSGLDTRAALNQLWPRLRAYLTAVPHTPAATQVVVISLGANDITALRSSASWRRDVEQLQQQLRAHLPEAWIIWLGLPPFAVFPLLPANLRRLLSYRAQAFDALAQVLLVEDPRTLLLGHGPEPSAADFAADGFHPNAQAIARWARELAQQIPIQTLNNSE